VAGAVPVGIVLVTAVVVVAATVVAVVAVVLVVVAVVVAVVEVVAATVVVVGSLVVVATVVGGESASAATTNTTATPIPTNSAAASPAIRPCKGMGGIMTTAQKGRTVAERGPARWTAVKWAAEPPVGGWVNLTVGAMISAMPLLAKKAVPVAQTGSGGTSSPVGPARADEGDPLWLRYADLVKLGFSPETSLIVAEAPVELASVTGLLLPDAR
jgi:hypothetical protein